MNFEKGEVVVFRDGDRSNRFSIYGDCELDVELIHINPILPSGKISSDIRCEKRYDLVRVASTPFSIV